MNNIIYIENGILASIFKNPSNAQVAIDNSLSSDMFTDYGSRCLFRDIEEAIKNKEAISIGNKRFKSNEYSLLAIIGSEYNPMWDVSEDAFLMDVDNVLDDYKNRRKQEIVSNTDDINETIQRLEELSNINVKSRTLSAADVILSITEDQAEKIKCGIRFFDQAETFAKRRFVVIGARSGMGKSAVSQILATEMANKGNKVLFFSLEMGERELGERSFAIHYGRFFNTIESEQEQNEMLANYDYDRAQNLRYCELFSGDLGYMRKTIINEKRYNGLDVVFVDYLQLLRVRGATEIDRLSIITSSLKRLAMELDICIIAPAQLNRDAEDKDAKLAEDIKEGAKIKPLNMSYLRGSGTIEQDADCVFTINANRGTPRILIYTAKNRHGRTGTSNEFMFIGEKMQLTEI